MQVRVRQVTSAEDLAEVRRLCWAYRTALADATSDRPEAVDMWYAEADYAALLRGLPGPHSPPDGAVFLGEVNGTARACGMTHRIDAQTCEIKRVFVDASARRLGLARQIVEAGMAQARADGYGRFVLDTAVQLTGAQRLYEAMGFAKIAPFYTPPEGFEDMLVFYGRDLT